MLLFIFVFKRDVRGGIVLMRSLHLVVRHAHPHDRLVTALDYSAHLLILFGSARGRKILLK